MILGTGSDVGKSTAAAAFCRIFARKGHKVTPFKAQNMSNNSYVTIEGGEIGRAQVVQAEAAGILPSVHMNPVLLKPSSEMGCQVVLHGNVMDSIDASTYHNLKPRLKKAIMESYGKLALEYDLIVMEGAGSCCEMNLKKTDLVNLPLAKRVNAPCVLVADIDRGGVFAQVIGTYDLMTQKEQDLTMGFLINKFRGDPSLFKEGIEYIEKKTRKPVLGLVPFYNDILIDPEDSVGIQEDRLQFKYAGPDTLNIAIIKLPAISNFTDLEILKQEKRSVVNYLSRARDLDNEYDCIIIPGTKNVVEDCLWLGRTGWKRAIRNFAKKGGRIMGICGGYQLLGRHILDPEGIESHRKKVAGLDLLPVETILERKKIVRKVTGTCLLNRKKIQGYEIHMGRTRTLDQKGAPLLKIQAIKANGGWEEGCTVNNGQIFGSYVHGILDAPGFRADFLNNLRRAKGLKERVPAKGRKGRYHEYDKLADHFERYCDIDRIIREVSSPNK